MRVSEYGDAVDYRQTPVRSVSGYGAGQNGYYDDRYTVADR